MHGKSPASSINANQNRNTIPGRLVKNILKSYGFVFVGKATYNGELSFRIINLNKIKVLSNFIVIYNNSYIF